KATEALAEYINRKMTIVDTTRREDVDGFRYIRREAVRALATFRNPGSAANGQGGMALLRIMAKDGPNPLPRMDERIDAAVGLARLKSALDRQYNPDYAIAQIGLFLDEFNRDYTESRRLQKDARFYPLLPWRGMALQLYDAVSQMRTDSGDNP